MLEDACLVAVIPGIDARSLCVVIGSTGFADNEWREWCARCGCCAWFEDIWGEVCARLMESGGIGGRDFGGCDG